MTLEEQRQIVEWLTEKGFPVMETHWQKGYLVIAVPMPQRAQK